MVHNDEGQFLTQYFQKKIRIYKSYCYHRQQLLARSVGYISTNSGMRYMMIIGLSELGSPWAQILRDSPKVKLAACEDALNSYRMSETENAISQAIRKRPDGWCNGLRATVTEMIVDVDATPMFNVKIHHLRHLTTEEQMNARDFSMGDY